MRGLASILVVGGLACAVGTVAMTTDAQSARVRAAAVEPAAPVAEARSVETDAIRRARLNDRMAEMLRSGKGRRLSEAPTAPSKTHPAARRRAPVASPRPPVSVPPPPSPVSSTRVVSDEISTIAPPLVRVSEPLRRTARGYTPPRLDLRTPPVVPTNDIECLTQALYYEARNESEEGQAAVAEVVINRSRAGSYPRKICDVVYQRNSRTCQFTFTCDGSIGRGAINRNAWGRAERIARSVYEGRSQSLLPRESVNYHANYVRPSWGRRLARVKQIGAHIFYGAPLNGGATPGAERGAPPTPRQGLQFVRNEALDRAYEAMKQGQAGPVPAAPAA